MASRISDRKLRRITIIAAIALFLTALLTVLFRYYNCITAAKISFILFLILVPVCLLPYYIRTLNNKL